MNIEKASINSTNGTQNTQKSNSGNNADSSVKFSEELKGLETKEDKTKEVDAKKDSKAEKESVKDAEKKEKADDKDKKIDGAIDGLNNVVDEINKKNFVNQSDDKTKNPFKNLINPDDNKKEGADLINNDLNIQDNKDKFLQMGANMNFSGDGQPFASFMNNNQNANQEGVLTSSAKELEEEAAILSTMAENIAMAKDNEVEKIQDERTQNEKTVHREDGIKILDVQSDVTIETVVKYDNIIMNKADVDVFTNLVQNGEVNLNNLEGAEKSVSISKTLADMLAKAKETNQPLRIDFDNDISVIIRISRDGKLSADFLPSSQVAEAYLKENLPLLKQRFDENNVQYDELNQREQRNRDRENNRRKDRNNE